jgi:hypothetical protein
MYAANGPTTELILTNSSEQELAANLAGGVRVGVRMAVCGWVAMVGAVIAAVV